MSFRAVVMRDPTVLLCAFFGRYRRLPNATVRAWRRRGGHGAESIRDIAQRMSGDNAQKSTRIALRAGDWLFWRRDICGRRYPNPRKTFERARLCRRCPTASLLPFCLVCCPERTRGREIGSILVTSRMAWVLGNKSVAPGPFLWLRGMILRF